jgi:hypothetical protein
MQAGNAPLQLAGYGPMETVYPFNQFRHEPDETDSGPVADTGPPIALTSFVGREAEIDAIVARLDDESTRLLTLIGPGGVGKTRLAAEVMRRVASDFADGARFVRLSPLRDPALTPAAVARALGVHRRGDRSLLDDIALSLATRHMLLVLDNFKHLLDSAPAWLVSLLAACPRLKVLVTSRTALNIGGEHRYAVPPLPVPDADDAVDSAAVALFIERARRPPRYRAESRRVRGDRGGVPAPGGSPPGHRACRRAGFHLLARAARASPGRSIRPPRGHAA